MAPARDARVKRPRRDDTPVPSRARPHKPPAKELSARKAAALGSGGGRLPRRIREEFDSRPPVRRTTRGDQPDSQRTRAGKREPKAARHDEAAEIRDAGPSRRAGNREADPGTRRDTAARKIARPH
jgi:hypothetical protein